MLLYYAPLFCFCGMLPAYIFLINIGRKDDRSAIAQTRQFKSSVSGRMEY